MKGLETVVRGKECGKAVETLSRAPEVVESERGEIFPASAQVEVVCNRAREAGTTGACVRYVKVLQQGQIITRVLEVYNRTCNLGQLASNSAMRRS